MRGIPRQAVEANLPVLGQPGARRRYRRRQLDLPLEHRHVRRRYEPPRRAGLLRFASLKLYAGWGVDFIKADDIARPAHREEIAALHRAIRKTGRPIVLSLSPGPALVKDARIPPARTPTCGASPTISGTTGACCGRTSS